MDENTNLGHRNRIRQKFLENGIKTFLDYEILELLLTYSIPRKDTKVIAKEIIKNYKTVNAVLKADYNDIKSLNIKGLGENSITFLKLIGDVSTVLYEQSIKEKPVEYSQEEKILNKDMLLKYLRSKIAFGSIEKFYVIYLSSSNEVIKFEENSSGTLDRSSVYPREIYKNVIKLNAKSIILAHNHPSGNINPSKSDIDLTNEVAKGLKNFGAILIEHIIITKNSYFSFLEEGLI